MVSLLCRSSPEGISPSSFVRSLQMSSGWFLQCCIGHWMFPNYNTLSENLNEKYLIISSSHPKACWFPWSSYVFWTHLPSLIRPYFADVISMTSFGWHWALNVSQLQYSLWRSKPRDTLLYLQHIPIDVDFLGCRKFPAHISRSSSFRSWQMSSAQPGPLGTEP